MCISSNVYPQKAYKLTLREVSVMTVKELKEKLNLFPDDFIVMIPNCNLHMSQNPIWYVPAINVAGGCNEADRCVFIDSEED